MFDSFIDSKNDQNKLYITGTALGSFGFTCEEIPVQSEMNDESKFKAALDQLLIFFKNTDDEDDKTLEKIRKFIKTLSDHRALCSLKTDKLKFSFKSNEDV